MSTVVVTNLAKRFGETQAVVDVSFAVEPARSLACWAPTGRARRRPSA